MAERDRMDEANEALDPETLYSKEYCIGESQWRPGELGIVTADSVRQS
jgi:hypothetical protein